MVFLSMLKWIAVVHLLFFGFACTEAEVSTTPNATEIAQKDSIEAAQAPGRKADDLPFLTSENCTELLKGYGEEHPESTVVLHSDFGDITIELYEETPVHRANFLYLINKKYYTDNCFFRIIPEFVLQGGNTEAEDKHLLRNYIGKYRIPHEILDEKIHKRGAVAAARDYNNNPNRESNPYQFYIVQGRVDNLDYIEAVEIQYEIKIPSDDRRVYLSEGGTPHLDHNHTVFGEVIDGMDVVDKIAAVERDAQDWPMQEVTFTLEVVESP